MKIDRRKALALLAYLAVTRQSHTRQALASLFWPEADPSRAYAYVRQALWEINQAVGEGWMVAEQDTVGLNSEADMWPDVAQFWRLLEDGLPGDDTLAQSYFTQALDLAREVGPTWLGGDCLKGMAGLAAIRGQAKRAARLWGAAEAQLVAGASYMDNGDCICFGRIMSTAQAHLGEAAFEAARAAGRALPIDEAMALALEETA